jgi:hypothetical protein
MTRPALQGFFTPCWGLLDAVHLRACLRKTNTELFISTALCPQAKIRFFFFM